MVMAATLGRALCQAMVMVASFGAARTLSNPAVTAMSGARLPPLARTPILL
jgi:hypothetical protein